MIGFFPRALSLSHIGLFPRALSFSHIGLFPRALLRARFKYQGFSGLLGLFRRLQGCFFVSRQSEQEWHLWRLFNTNRALSRYTSKHRVFLLLFCHTSLNTHGIYGGSSIRIGLFCGHASKRRALIRVRTLPHQSEQSRHLWRLFNI